MKKTYQQPQAQSIALHTEAALLNNSLTISGDQTLDGGDARSSERAWSSSVWDRTDND